LEDTDLILVRHGESLQNRGDVGSAADPGLTELGWRQAELVADWLANSYRADAVLSSPMRRAMQTANLISRRIGRPVGLCPGVVEADAPYWTELPASRQSEPFALWDEVWVPSAEIAPNYTAFRARLRAALEAILAEHSGQTVIVVAHGGSIGTILRSLFTGHAMPIFTQNTGVTHVAWKEGHWQLDSHNLLEHLAPLMGRPAPFPIAPGLPFPWTTNSVSVATQEHYRRVALMPNDGSTVNTNADTSALLRSVSLGSDAVVLDVGCGAGDVALALAPHVGRVIGVDATAAMLERLELARIAQGVANLDLEWADAAHLPVADRSVDLATAHDLLHLLEDPGAFVNEAQRVLKATGALLIDEPCGPTDSVTRATREAIEIRRNPSFRRLMTEEQVARLATSAGWSVDVVQNYEVWHSLSGWLAGAAADEATSSAVRKMVEASMDTDAAGMQVQRSREGDLVFTEQRVQLLARPPALAAGVGP
jgi:broad specificity phosphatase PhoE/SAM-dependent methyltransferase